MSIKTMLGLGLAGEFTREMFNEMPRLDQNNILQRLYDKGYSGRDLSNFTGMNIQTIYNRIDAHRGRSGFSEA